MVVFDSTYLIDLFNPKLQGDQRLALDQLIAELSRAKTRVLIPAPCITELLVYAGAAATDYNDRLIAALPSRLFLLTGAPRPIAHRCWPMPGPKSSTAR